MASGKAVFYTLEWPFLTPSISRVAHPSVHPIVAKWLGSLLTNPRSLDFGLYHLWAFLPINYAPNDSISSGNFDT